MEYLVGVWRKEAKVARKWWLRLKDYSPIHPIMHKNYILVINGCKAMLFFLN